MSKSFGAVRAVADASFDAPRGRVVGLLGPNGAGKTTTIRILTGYLPPTSGAARVDGLDSLERSIDVRRRIGYLPETAPLYPEMRVLDYLDFRGRLHGLRRQERRRAAGREIDRRHLRDVQRRRIGHLSKGYRQRVGFAAALLHDPPALILDEPASGLDPAEIAETRTLIRELAQDKAVLLSSHILPEVEATCDDVVVMVRGRVRARGAVRDLTAPGASPVYIVEMQQPPDNAGAVEAMRAVRGAASVEPATAGDGWLRLRVEAAPGAGDLREPLARAASGLGLLVRELRRERVSLESLFMRLMDQPPEAEP